MAKNGTVAYVAKIPPCDINAAHGPAYADASLRKLRGTWAFVCRECFELHGGALGTGAGQELKLESERPEPEPVRSREDGRVSVGEALGVKNNGYPEFLDGEDLPPANVHRYTIDTDRCICGGEVVYFEDQDPEGEGCEVEGKPWPSALSSQTVMEEEYGDEEHDAVQEHEE